MDDDDDLGQSPTDIGDELRDFQSDPKGWLYDKLSNRKGREAGALRDVIDERITALVWILLGVGVAYMMTKKGRRR